MPAAPAPDAAVFAEHFSLEATRPTAAEIAALADIVPPATPVYFSAVPTITRQEVIAAAASLRKAGLEPIIHVAARRLASAGGLAGIAFGPARRRRRAAAAGDRWRC
jgi:methylenetetrahydrofolate reductase (NADPH)